MYIRLICICMCVSSDFVHHSVAYNGAMHTKVLNRLTGDGTQDMTYHSIHPNDKTVHKILCVILHKYFHMR